MSEFIIPIPWESNNHCITPSIVENVLKEYCQKRNILWKKVGSPQHNELITIQKIEFSNVPSNGSMIEDQKDHLKTAIHARCFLKIIQHVASL
jgi:hypothetical protein